MMLYGPFPGTELVCIKSLFWHYCAKYCVNPVLVHLILTTTLYNIYSYYCNFVGKKYRDCERLKNFYGHTVIKWFRIYLPLTQISTQCIFIAHPQLASLLLIHNLQFSLIVLKENCVFLVIYSPFLS